MPTAEAAAPQAPTRALIRGDLARWREIYGTYLYVIHPGCLAVLVYRLAHGLLAMGPLGMLLSRALSFLNIVVTGADIHARAEIGPGLFLPHSQGVIVAGRVRAGRDLTLYAGVVLGQGASGGFPTIGDGVTVWTHSTAVGQIAIGDGAQIGAHSLVMIDVPAHHNALGVPAKVRPQRPEPA